jgi:hypothetical protein
VNQKVRTKTASKQTLLSLIILGILAIVSGGVFIVQFNYNPAVQQMAPVLASGGRSPASAPASADKSVIFLPPGQLPLSPPETFDAATLSDKINGKAELYLSAGFVRLYSQRFKDEAVNLPIRLPTPCFSFTVHFTLRLWHQISPMPSCNR